MTWPITPDPGIHNVPESTLGPGGGAPMLATMASNLIGGMLKWVLATIINDLEGLPVVGPLVGDVVVPLSNAFANLLGILGIVGSDINLIAAPTADNFAALVSSVESIPLLSSVATLISDVGGTVISDVSTAINTAKSDATSAVSELDALISGVSGTAISDVVAVLQMVQQTLDAVANALGQTGSGHSVTQVQGYLREIPTGNISGLSGYLANLSATGEYVGSLAVSSLTGLATGVESWLQAGTALPSTVTVGGSQLTGALNGAVTFGGSALSTVLGGIDSATGDFTGTVTGAVDSAATIAGQAASTVQANAAGALNSIVQGIDNTAVSADQTVAQAQSAISGFMTNLYNALPGGGGASSAGSSDVASLTTGQTSTLGAHTQQISQINAKMATLYGSGGASINESATFSPGSLPSGFTAVTPQYTMWGTAYDLCAGGAAMLSTGGTNGNGSAGSDDQTVAGVWSDSDYSARWLLLRANSTCTSLVYAKIQSQNPYAGAPACEIGCLVAGVKSVLSVFHLPGSGNRVAGAEYAFAASGDTFTLTGPNGLNESCTDSAGVSQVGSSYRYGGFGTDGWSRQVDSYTAAGSYTYAVPSWAADGTVFYRTALGAGGGASDVSVSGGAYFPAGAAGSWASDFPVLGTDIPSGTASFGVVVGAAGAVVFSTPGPAGGASTVSVSGGPTLTGAGGAGGAASSGTGEGVSPNVWLDSGASPYAGIPQTGGAPSAATGNAPGGGGGFSYTNGAYPGAPGAVWIAAVDTTVPGSLGAWAFYDTAQVGPTAAFVATAESTSSTTYTDLTTTTDEVTVTVGPSGTVLVSIAAICGVGSNVTGWMGLDLSGANTISAATNETSGRSISTYLGSIYDVGWVGGAGLTQSNSYLITGLTPGATVFKLKYRGTSTVTFSERSISVIPF